MRAQQATYSSPVSSRLLFEGGFGYFFSRWGGRAKENPNTNDFVRMVEQCTAGCPANGNIAGPRTIVRRRSTSSAIPQQEHHLHVASGGRRTSPDRGASSSATAAPCSAMLSLTNRSGNNLHYRVNNGVPNQLTSSSTTSSRSLWMRNDAFYAQEQWTIDRLTLQGALRYDRSWSWAPPQQDRARRASCRRRSSSRKRRLWTPTTTSRRAWRRPTISSATGRRRSRPRSASTWMRPRRRRITGSSNPTSRIPQNVARTWTDADGDFVSGLRSPQPERAGSASERRRRLRRVSRTATSARTVFSNTIDPDILSGWGVRPSDWQVGVSVQHEVLPRVSVEVGYFRRWFQGFTVTDNLAVTRR